MLFLQTAFVIASCGETSRRKTGEEILLLSSSMQGAVSVDGEFKRSLVVLSDNMEQIVAKDLAAVRQVSHIFTDVVNGSVLVWIAVDDPTPSVRRQIFDRELALIGEFPETDFDFNIIPRMGRAAEEMINGEARVAYERPLERAL